MKLRGEYSKKYSPLLFYMETTSDEILIDMIEFTFIYGSNKGFENYTQDQKYDSIKIFYETLWNNTIVSYDEKNHLKAISTFQILQNKLIFIHLVSKGISFSELRYHIKYFLKQGYQVGFINKKADKIRYATINSSSCSSSNLRNINSGGSINHNRSNPCDRSFTEKKSG